VIDLSYAAAAKLAAALPGSAEVEVELITRFDEAPATASAASATAATLQSPVPAAIAAPPPVQVAAVPMPNTPALRVDEAPERPAPRAAAASSAPAPAAPVSAVTVSAAPSPVVFAPATSASTPASAPAAPASAPAAAASAAAPLAAPDALGPGRYVQLGAYQSRDGAEAALSRLRANGLSEPVTVRRDGPWHKLVAGPFAQPADAQAAQRRLRAATGIEAFVLLR
jgi:cell division protein FtsN